MMALEGARRRLFNRNNRRVAHIILHVPGIRYIYIYYMYIYCVYTVPVVEKTSLKIRLRGACCIITPGWSWHTVQYFPGLSTAVVHTCHPLYKYYYYNIYQVVHTWCYIHIIYQVYIYIYITRTRNTRPRIAGAHSCLSVHLLIVRPTRYLYVPVYTWQYANTAVQYYGGP